MKERTQLNITPQEPKISYKSSILSLGSCFSVHISDRLEALKYSILQNPCGITFNPASLYTAIKRTISPDSLLSQELNFHNSLWSHPDFHSAFNHPDKDTYLDNVNRSLNAAKKHLESSNFIFITIGTCFVFRSLKSNNIVNNCHKQPSADFSRELLQVNEVADCLMKSRELLRAHSKRDSVQIILTVSPVRHIKNGLAQDKKSKATALLAIHQLVEQYEDCHYFPAYEIMMDDLRDYRYFKADLIHPSNTAIDYIFEQFDKTWLASADGELRKQITSINKRLAHRPLFPDTEQHQSFEQKLRADIEKIESAFAHLKGKFSTS